jgi:hypothetical protein
MRLRNKQARPVVAHRTSDSKHRGNDLCGSNREALLNRLASVCKQASRYRRRLAGVCDVIHP